MGTLLKVYLYMYVCIYILQIWNKLSATRPAYCVHTTGDTQLLPESLLLFIGLVVKESFFILIIYIGFIP